MTAERALRLLVHEARAVKDRAYQVTGGKGPDANTLEMFLLLHPSIGAALELAPMDDLEAIRAKRDLHETLIGKNAPQTTI